MHYIYAYLLTAVVFVGIDLVWLGVVAKTFYATQLKGLMSPRPNLPAAVIFYLVFALGLMVFVLGPAISAQSGLGEWWRGALFGFFSYGTYDLTNLATLKNWPAKLTVVDLIWGTVLSGLTSVVILALFGH